MNLRLKNIVLPLSAFTLEVDIEITSQVTAIFGPSGAGKTSLLDLIAGLRRPKSAVVQLDHRVLMDTAVGENIPARRRRIGYVPQDLALFPHLSVQNNLLYGHPARNESTDAGLFGYAHVTETLELQSLTGRAVTNLSGGEKQRVALARALLTSPELLLLDEPLANLDNALKKRIVSYLVRIRDEFCVPMLYVTHDIDEIGPLCGFVLCLDRGRIIDRR